MSSKRLKGKVLKNIYKLPLIMRVYQQALKAKMVSKIIIASSDERSDIPIKNFCKKNNILFYCGPLNDVFLRYIEILNKEKSKSFIRICADSPLVNPKLIDFACKYYSEKKCDLITNVMPRSFPRGNSVEVINSNTFVKSYSLQLSKYNKEHITSYFYENRRKYKIYNFKNKVNLSNFNFSIDTKDDLKIIRKLFRKYGSLEEINKYLSINIQPIKEDNDQKI